MFTNNSTITRVSKFVVIGLALGSLTACNAVQRALDVGKEPELAKIENPVDKPGYEPITLPMPAPESAVHHSNSLWRNGARHFFKDQRASRVGDILTVVIDVEDEADFSNSATRTRNNTEDSQVTSLLGFQNKLQTFLKILPSGVDPTDLVNIASALSNAGTGTTEREETVEITMAAIVTQVLPNGNMVISGKQELRVNYDVRSVMVSGVVRPGDISNSNTIQHTQIAEARIAYGGRGQLMDVVQPRYGHQILDIVMPF